MKLDRFVITYSSGRWVVLRHVAVVNDVAVYAETEGRFRLVNDACKFIAAALERTT